MVRVVTDNRPDPAAMKRRRPFVFLLAAVMALLLVFAFWLGTRTGQNPSAGGSAPATASESSTPTPPRYMTVDGEVVPGLWRGTATVGSGNSKAIYGIPYGWPRTIDGAVGAAMNIEAAFYSLPAMVENTAAQLFPKLYTGAALEEVLEGKSYVWFRKKGREMAGMNDDGVVLDLNGKPSKEKRFYGGGIPQYGAYIVRSCEKDSTGQPSRVEVAVLIPMYGGTGTDDDMSNVHLQFKQINNSLVWVDGDWRSETSGSVENVWKKKVSNQGWEHLKSLVGEGWAVPADATQEPFEGAVLTQ